MTAALPYEVGASGVCVRIRVRPGAGRSELAGLREDAGGAQAFVVRVRERPEKGKATTAAMETLARALGLSPSRLRLKSCGKSRVKLVEIEGAAVEIERELGKLMVKQG